MDGFTFNTSPGQALKSPGQALKVLLIKQVTILDILQLSVKISLLFQ